MVNKKAKSKKNEWQSWDLSAKASPPTAPANLVLNRFFKFLEFRCCSAVLFCKAMKEQLAKEILINRLTLDKFVIGNMYIYKEIVTL